MGSQGRNCALTLKESQGHVIELLDGQKVPDGEELGEGATEGHSSRMSVTGLGTSMDMWKEV